MINLGEYTRKMLNWLTYIGEERPPGIHPARWRAMVAHLKREYLYETHEE